MAMVAMEALELVVSSLCTSVKLALRESWVTGTSMGELLSTVWKGVMYLILGGAWQGLGRSWEGLGRS